MTVIAAAIGRDGHVVMGADSAGISGWTLMERRDPKIYRNGDLLIGFTTSFRMGQLLGLALQVPDLPRKAAGAQEIFEWMVKDFVPAARDCLTEGAWSRVRDGQEDAGTFLVAVRKQLFEVCDDWQVAQPFQRYAAVGCGRELALGAMYVALSHDDGPDEAVRVALRCAEQHSAGVRRPFHVHELWP